MVQRTRDKWLGQPCIINVTLAYYLYSGYVKELIAELFEVFTAGKATNTTPIPDFLCSDFKRPNKKTAIKQTGFAKYKTRQIRKFESCIHPSCRRKCTPNLSHCIRRQHNAGADPEICKGGFNYDVISMQACFMKEKFYFSCKH